MKISRMTRAQQAYVRRHTSAGRESTGTGELNIVPFLDIVVNLMLFLLATSATVLATAQVESQLPTHGRGPPKPLVLVVTLTGSGIVASANGRTLSPSCRADAPSGATPVGGPSDYRALARCARAVKDAFPGEHTVTIGADATVPYERVMRAMDALRADDRGPLFPEILLAAGVR